MWETVATALSQVVPRYNTVVSFICRRTMVRFLWVTVKKRKKNINMETFRNLESDMHKFLLAVYTKSSSIYSLPKATWHCVMPVGDGT
jgi:hypothetical protein